MVAAMNNLANSLSVTKTRNGSKISSVVLILYSTSLKPLELLGKLFMGVDKLPKGYQPVARPIIGDQPVAQVPQDGEEFVQYLMNQNTFL